MSTQANLKRKREESLTETPRHFAAIAGVSCMRSTGASSKPAEDVKHDANRAAQSTSHNVDKKVKIDDNAGNQQDFLREALKRVQELERELSTLTESSSSDDGDGNDGDRSEFERNANEFEAEALGFAVCARETLQFLAGEGLQADDPLVQSLRQRLVGKCDVSPFTL